ncbi:unnamed protein product [Zymoseptoria tritici ST99CH_1A5]|uniref:DUF7580 domain-containing protein n=3 Tax=Zymoseptoria tritici TaxID=1047171 RepID=A0A2H1GTF2_ZYMTR|nr:unnamed protein product [Zymoseptoria tritici ST99CH_1E4]SMR59671.1 unnamed protein product [Zymoseptoria tritici ST99CH_3D1]SMY26861.1 unnamed protein product [Zymoseptoria tritici ST99CH_1A5]
MAEVAGLVLAGIPLLISAVEHYEECFRILGCMRQFKQEYRQVRNRVKTLELEYDLTLDKLFLDVVDSQEELARLKNIPDDQGWVEVEARLKERLLPKVHRAYLDTMKDLQETVRDLSEELGLDKATFQDRISCSNVTAPSGQTLSNNQKPSTAKQIKSVAKRSQGKLTYEGQRVRFSQGKNRREALFTQIDGYMKSLDGLMSKNDDVTKMLLSSKRPTVVPRALLDFWRHARNVYLLLMESWKCPCRAEHCADLRLMHREATNVHFDICFWSSICSSQCVQCPWASHQVVVEENIFPKLPAASAIPAPLPAVLHSTSPQAAGLAKMKPLRSAFKKSPNLARDASATRASATFTIPDRTTTTPKVVLTAIENLCQAISAHLDTQPCSGLLTGGGIDTEYSLQTSTLVSRPLISVRTITLAKLLSDTSTTPSRILRYKIALAIASSQLQLHSSSWLGQHWSGENILFNVIDGSIILDQPHLRAGFRQIGPASGQTSSADETFMTLGILLLELCFGQTLENSPFRDQYRSPEGQQDSMMDLAAASKWAERVEGEAGPEYADAVYWCLAMRRGRQVGNAWRQDLLQIVIEPLSSSCQQLTSRVI